LTAGLDFLLLSQLLQDKQDNITSSACQEEVFYYQLMEVTDFRNDVILAEACRTDVEKYCKDVEPGGELGVARGGQACGFGGLPLLLETGVGLAGQFCAEDVVVKDSTPASLLHSWSCRNPVGPLLARSVSVDTPVAFGWHKRLIMCVHCPHVCSL
jgi:hypothetical protein